MKRTLRNLLLAATAVIGCNIAADATDFGELYGQRASLFDTLGTDSTSIVMLGNSLTHGCEWHELFGMPNIDRKSVV